MSRKFLIIAGVLFATAQANAAATEIRTSSAELATGDGAARVYAEITRSAEDVCAADYGGPKLVREQAERARCIDAAINAAVADVDHPNLNAVHASVRDLD